MPRIKSSPCPYCGRENDAATAVSDGNEVVPERGDIAVCLYCAEVSLYDEQLNLEKVPAGFMEELAEVQPEAYKEIVKAQLVIITMMNKAE